MQNKNTNTGSKLSMDLQDSPGDKKEMQEPEITVIDLPEVTDIPWQENITNYPHQGVILFIPQ